MLLSGSEDGALCSAAEAETEPYATQRRPIPPSKSDEAQSYLVSPFTGRRFVECSRRYDWRWWSMNGLMMGKKKKNSALPLCWYASFIAHWWASFLSPSLIFTDLDIFRKLDTNYFKFISQVRMIMSIFSQQNNFIRSWRHPCVYSVLDNGQ